MEIKITSETYSGKAPGKAVKPSRKEPEAEKAKRLDTYEPSAGSMPFGDKMLTGAESGLSLNGPIPSPGELKLYEPDPDADGINWKEVEASFFGASVTLDNADRIEAKVEGIASMYLAVKDQLEEKFAGREDKLAEKMSRLDSLFQQAKSRMVSSYKGSVGSFYEQMGNKGISARMGDSLSKAIDGKVAEMEAYGKEHRFLGNPEDERKLPYNVKAAFLQAGMIAKREGLQAKGQEVSVSGSQAQGSQVQGEYSLKDLGAAGFAAKAASKMNPKELSLMGDDELGIQMALRYMKMAKALGHFGVGDKMSSLILSTFGTFLDRYSGGALTDKDRASASYNYALKQYQSSGDIRQALEKSARKYLDDGFFNQFISSQNGTGASKFTRYRLELSQFMDSMERGDASGMLDSIAGKGRPYLSMYA